MDTKTILQTIDPNPLRERISQIDREIGSLQSEREFVDRRFQAILSHPRRSTTTFELKPLVDEQREVPPLRRPQGAPAGENLWEAK
jgi:hypothetical protein